MNLVESFIIIFCIVLMTWMSILCYIKITKIYAQLYYNNDKNNKEDDGNNVWTWKHWSGNNDKNNKNHNNHIWILTYWTEKIDPVVLAFDEKEKAMNFKRCVKQYGYRTCIDKRYIFRSSESTPTNDPE